MRGSSMMRSFSRGSSMMRSLSRGSLMMRSFSRGRSFSREGSGPSPLEMAKSLTGPPMPSIILVNTFEERNLGSVSRAMLNFGCHDLRLVAPQCNHLGEEARKLAVGSVELLENATVFPTLEAAIGDLQFVLATTARNRAANYAIFSPSNAAKRIINKAPFQQGNAEKTAIVFGPEKNGLSNDLLSLTDGVININTFEGYPVLNLAQSVTLICSEVWRHKTEIKEDIPVTIFGGGAGQKDQLAQNSEILFFLDRLKEGLIERGYASTAKNNNIKIEELVQDSSFLGLTRIIKRSGLTSRELLMLNGMLSALMKKK